MLCFPLFFLSSCLKTSPDRVESPENYISYSITKKVNRGGIEVVDTLDYQKYGPQFIYHNGVYYISVDPIYKPAIIELQWQSDTLPEGDDIILSPNLQTQGGTVIGNLTLNDPLHFLNDQPITSMPVYCVATIQNWEGWKNYYYTGNFSLATIYDSATSSMLNVQGSFQIPIPDLISY